MKTTTFCKTLAAAGLSLAMFSCNKMDNQTPSTDGLVAARIFANIQTKASGTAWADGDAIGISTTGNEKKDGKEYVNIKYTTDPTGEFTGAPIYFQNTADVTFTAYYPFAGAEEALPGAAGVVTASTIAANQAAAEQPKIDFMWAQTTAKVATPVVAFSGANAFKHKMSMVSITFVKGDDVLLADLTRYTIKGLVMDGQFNTVIGEAKAAGTQADLVMALTGVPEDTQYAAAPVILFPQTVAGGKFALEVELNGQTYSTELTVPAAATALAEGTNYTFKVTVKKTGITSATAEIADWATVAGDDVDAVM